MIEFSQRTEIVIGREGVEKLKDASVIVFGVGGVGSYVVEALARAGIGKISIVDFDDVDITNINRQIPALHSTIGRYKVDVMAERVKDINPQIEIIPQRLLFDESNSEELLSGEYDFVVDAIDMMKSKIHLIEESYKRGLNIISSMGMGNKLDPTMIEITDLYKTEMCPLAKVLRRELKKKGVKKLPVVYSKEKPRETAVFKEGTSLKRVNGSMSFVPSSAGLAIASYIVRQIIE